MLSISEDTLSEVIMYADQSPFPLLGFSFNGTAAMVLLPKFTSPASET